MNYFWFFTFFISVSTCALISNRINFEFKNLKDDVILMISKYLICPHYHLGSLNKEFYQLFKQHPYHKLLAERLGMPELLDAQGVDGLVYLGKVSHVKDPVHLFKIISKDSLFSRKRFGMNLGHVIRYAIRADRELLSNPVKINGSSDKYFAYNLKESNEYELLFDYMIMCPHSVQVSFYSMNIKAGKIVMQMIMNPPESLRVKLEHIFKPESSLNFGLKMYNHFYMLLKDHDESIINFFICGIVANVPEEFYLKLILKNELGIIFEFLDTIFTSDQISESPEEARRIYDTLTRIIDRISEPEAESIQFYLLFNSIRFGGFVVDYEQCERIFREMNLNNERLSDVILAASLAKQHHFVLEMYRSFVLSDIINAVFNFAQIRYTGIHVFASLLGSLNEFERKALLGDYGVVSSFFAHYDKFYITNDALNTRFRITMRLKENVVIESGFDLPETLEYDLVRNPQNEQRLKIMIKIHMFKSCDHNTNSVLEILTRLDELDLLKGLFSTTSTGPIDASVEVMHAISENDKIFGIVQMYCLKLKVLAWQKSKLFERPVAKLVGILSGVSSRNTISSFDSADQFRNYEEFQNKNIADIFMTDIVSNSDQSRFVEDLFYIYRHALLYWLKGPHRSRLAELVPTYAGLLQKLALEVEYNDSKFLLDAIKLGNISSASVNTI